MGSLTLRGRQGVVQGTLRALPPAYRELPHRTFPTSVAVQHAHYRVMLRLIAQYAPRRQGGAQ